MKLERQLTGKSLIFTDLHIGISSDKESRQRIAKNVIHELIDSIDREGINQVFFLGDLFHQRTSIEVTSLNVANTLVRELANHCEVFLLQGNHDLYEKYNSVITSLNIFDLHNVNIISTPTELELNSQKVLLVPWLCGQNIQTFIDHDKMDDKYDIMMGHFDIGYSGDITNKGNAYINAYKTGGKTFDDADKTNIVSEILHHTNDFSTIYMGHVHEHETITFANRVWHIVGSPQFQVHDMKRLPDSRKHHGYYILNSDNKEEFHDCVSVPKFVTLYASDMVKGTVDESKLKGAIVRRCYDIVLTDEQKTQMENILHKANVYEEDSSVFVLGVNEDGESIDGEEPTQDLGLLIDKFDFIKTQIDKISHPAIDNAKLLELMKGYYARAMEVQ